MSTGAMSTGAMSTARTEWTGRAQIEAKLRRLWDSGALLRGHANGEPFEAISLPLRGPTVADIATRLEEMRRWAHALEAASDHGRNFSLTSKTIGGGKHLIGATEIPARAVIESYSQAWRLLGVAGAGGPVAVFERVLLESGKQVNARAWALAHPLKAVELAAEWPAILAARDWLDWHRGSGLYLRQVDAPGVDTKLIERHRAVLAELLGVGSGMRAFNDQLGFAQKPSMVRMRFDPALFGMPEAVTEAVFRLDELTGLEAQIEQALIVENEISYLSVPVPRAGVVLWGKGYDVEHPASLDWLRRADQAGRVSYWGDIDTHGFQILNRVRGHLPGVRSVMMDQETLLAHEARWGGEPAPTNAALPRLSAAEAALYADLVTDRFAPMLRLEQERIDWRWVQQQLHERCDDVGAASA